MSSPGFSFREMMNAWDLTLLEAALDDKIGALLDSGEFSMFLLRDKEVFGVTEEGRVTFARIIDPEDEDKDWAKDASFMGVNLTQTVTGHPGQAVFSKKDFKKFKVIDRDTALEKLSNQAKTPSKQESPDFVIIKK